MEGFQQVLPILMTIGLAVLLILMHGLWRALARRASVSPEDVLTNAELAKSIRTREWREAFANASDLRSAIAVLDHETQVEIAESFLNEQEPFRSLATEILQGTLFSPNEALRRTSISLITSPSIPPIRCITLAEQVLSKSPDPFMRIEAIGVLLQRLDVLDSDTESSLITAIAQAVSASLQDRNESVRARAEAAFHPSGPLYPYLEEVSDFIRRLARDAASGGAAPYVHRFMAEHSAIFGARPG